MRSTSLPIASLLFTSRLLVAPVPAAAEEAAPAGEATPAVASTPAAGEKSAADLAASGTQAYQAQDYARAESDLAASVRLDPRQPMTRYTLSQVYMRTGKYAQALAELEQCRDAYQLAAASGVSSQVERERRREERIYEVRETLRQVNSPAGARTNPSQIADVARLESELRQLESDRNQLEISNPVPAFVFLSIGSASFRLGRNDDAEKNFRQALSIDPKLGEAHNNLAVILMIKERYDEALDEVKAAQKAGFQVNPKLREDIERRKKEKQAAARG